MRQNGIRKRKIFFAALPVLLFVLILPLQVSAQSDTYRKDCWSKSDCMTRTANCESCFEMKEDLCGASRGFCYAKPEPVTLSISLGGLSQVHDPAQYLSTLYTWMVSVTGILAGIMIMIGGLIYLTAGGSGDRVSTAKSYIESALAGLVLALTSYLILQTVNPALLGLKFPKIPLPRTVFPGTFCEDLAQNSEIQIDAVANGKTACGDLGIPKIAAGATSTAPDQLPTECVYGKCENEEEACLICKDAICPAAASCFACAGTRLDGALRSIKTGDGVSLGDVIKKRQVLGKQACESLNIRSSGSKKFTCELADGQGILGSTVGDSLVEFADKMTFAELVVSGKIKMALLNIGGNYLGTRLEESGVGAGTTIRQGTQVVTGASATVAILRSVAKGTGILNLIAASTVAAARELVTTITEPESIIGDKAVCALAVVDCSKVASCQDYGDIIFKGSANQTLKDLTAAWQKTMLMNHAISFWYDYCVANPCQLPTRCGYTSEKDQPYWTPGGGRSVSALPENPPTGDIYGATADRNCVPVEMVAATSVLSSISEDWTTNGDFTYHFSDVDTSRWITGKSLSQQYGVPRNKIYPIVYPFEFLYPGKKQGRGMLCETDAECESGLYCRTIQAGFLATYNDVKRATMQDRSPISVSNNQEPTTVEYKRCGD